MDLEAWVDCWVGVGKILKKRIALWNTEKQQSWTKSIERYDLESERVAFNLP